MCSIATERCPYSVLIRVCSTLQIAADGTVTIVQGLSISPFAQEKLTLTEKELLEERDIAEAICAE